MTKCDKIREIIEQLGYDLSVSALDIVNEIQDVLNDSNIPEIEDERKNLRERQYGKLYYVLFKKEKHKDLL